ncbi:hypothetical protein A9G45_11000 [Gilliamella sp. HK2]|jgi:hypothetical protein|uniref:hypothetical protein n=1 Tax=unclassified Gilliamella TaxID=2685620 RepID=UPI00080DF975|nr:hypothetical protein [Gilliamella apicola]OCG26330.1 hypothetical protein A9G45_11000 [Gilliamella apicola]OCG27799.1 hypothetical protein A9G46_02905 [Gilliamella apicola]
MKFKTMLFILLSSIFTGQNAYANSDEDLDTIPEEFRFPKYDNIAHPPIDVEYKGKKGTALFLSNTFDDGRRNLEVYFLTNNNKELYKAFEIYPYQYDELLSIFEYEYIENKTKSKSILILTKEVFKSSIHYRYFELPVLIDNDGVLRALYFIGDDALVAKIGCIDNFKTKKRCEFSTKEGLIKYLNKERKQ